MKEKTFSSGNIPEKVIPERIVRDSDNNVTFLPGTFTNLMSDIAFKWVFGRDTNKDLLISLLNELIPDKHITDLTFYKENHIPYSKEFKKSSFDVSCKLDDGTYVDVEVQVKGQDNFGDRCLYYSTFNIQSQVKAGADEYELKPVYVVSIDAFSRKHADGWNDRILSSYSIREDQNHELMTDKLHFVYVELNYFNKKWEDIDNDRERFYFCLKRLHELDYLPEGLTEGIFGKLVEQARFSAMTVEMKDQYIKHMTTEIDRRAQLKYAHRQGLEEAARNLKSLGVSMDIIVKSTGFSVEQIAAL